jgi:hypothetical protein
VHGDNLRTHTDDGECSNAGQDLPAEGEIMVRRET